jgi:hypothetical protein
MLPILALALAILTGVFYWASINQNSGVYWAEQICSQAQVMCQAPSWLLIPTAACILLALVWQIFRFK